MQEQQWLQVPSLGGGAASQAPQSIPRSCPPSCSWRLKLPLLTQRSETHAVTALSSERHKCLSRVFSHCPVSSIHQPCSAVVARLVWSHRRGQEARPHSEAFQASLWQLQIAERLLGGKSQLDRAWQLSLHSALIPRAHKRTHAARPFCACKQSMINCEVHGLELTASSDFHHCQGVLASSVAPTSHMGSQRLCRVTTEVTDKWAQCAARAMVAAASCMSTHNGAPHHTGSLTLSPCAAVLHCSASCLQSMVEVLKMQASQMLG